MSVKDYELVLATGGLVADRVVNSVAGVVSFITKRPRVAQQCTSSEAAPVPPPKRAAMSASKSLVAFTARNSAST